MSLVCFVIPDEAVARPVVGYDDLAYHALNNEWVNFVIIWYDAIRYDDRIWYIKSFSATVVYNTSWNHITACLTVEPALHLGYLIHFKRLIWKMNGSKQMTSNIIADWSPIVRQHNFDMPVSNKMYNDVNTSKTFHQYVLLCHIIITIKLIIVIMTMITTI